MSLTFQGHLSGFGIEEQLPTIAVVAHYDAFGIAPVSSYLLYMQSNSVYMDGTVVKCKTCNLGVLGLTFPGTTVSFVKCPLARQFEALA